MTNTEIIENLNYSLINKIKDKVGNKKIKINDPIEMYHTIHGMNVKYPMSSDLIKNGKIVGYFENDVHEIDIDEINDTYFLSVLLDNLYFGNFKELIVK